jgi:hypothetical protein
MSFDLPASIERELERCAQAKHISAEEAAVKFIQAGLDAKQDQPDTLVVTDADIDAYDKAFPGFKAFADVTDEQWDKVLENAREMSKQGLSDRG